MYQRGIRNIDCILVTHLHEDHFGGIIHIINNFKVGTLIDNGDIFYDEKYQNNILDAAKKKSIKRLIVKKNDIIKGFEKFDIIVLNPGKNGGYRSINDSSIVIKCIDKSSEGSMLLSGDIEEAAIEKILCFDNVLKSDVIKMPHHGQSDCGLLIEKFLHTVNPRVAIITNKNTASINPELLRFLTSQNVDIRITGKSGFFVLQKNPEK